MKNFPKIWAEYQNFLTEKKVQKNLRPGAGGGGGPGGGGGGIVTL
jgi:hypothetical protein